VSLDEASFGASYPADYIGRPYLGSRRGDRVKKKRYRLLSSADPVWREAFAVLMRRRKKLPWRGVLPSLNLLPRVAHGAGAGLDLDASVNYNAKPPPGPTQCCWHLSQALRPHVPHTGAHSIAKTSSELHTNAIWPISELDEDAENIYKNLLRRCTRISDLPTASIKCLLCYASIAHSSFISLLPLYHP
jgi:hypothetical protein